MIDLDRNRKINAALSALYEEYCADYLTTYIQAFGDGNPPERINEFGIIDEERYDADNGILFVAKETNDWDNKDFQNGYFFRKWMNSITKQGLSGHAKEHPLMWYNIGRWASLLDNPSQSIPALAEAKGEAIEKIGTIAFTNINKVRGKNQAKSEYASLAYSDISGMLLREELSIIQPKMIVCCGTYYEFVYHVRDSYTNSMYTERYKEWEGFRRSWHCRKIQKFRFSHNAYLLVFGSE